MKKRVAIVGGGVIGGGWAARFLLNGWDVRISDPDPEAKRKIGEVLVNARLALPGLTDHALPEEGQLSFHTSIADAVEGAIWVQESVPERLDIKQAVYAEIEAAIDEGAIIGSSTSGFKPSQLQQGSANPGRIVVTHPFNPVYLLPLIELVTTDANPEKVADSAKSILSGLGFFPLHLKKEIDAHIADRFLEAVWREALWLVKDGYATTEEIDEAIRMGFGLRWAQMGLFETYRVAGGEAGMRHFMAQFGPALEWPWTKLMDVPAFTDELVDLIADQSDAQSGQHSIRDLERIRDRNLVAILRALKGNGNVAMDGWGAGAVIRAQDARLKAPEPDLEGPIPTVRRAVPLDWTDYNGHMNEARYLQAFGDATDRFMEMIGCDADYIASGGSYFTAETHIRHLDEVHTGAMIEIVTICLLGGGKKMHLFHEMRVGDRLVATGEHMLIHVSLETRKASPPAPHIEQKLEMIAAAHSQLPTPEGVGKAIGVR